MRAKCVLREKCLRGRIPEADLTAQISRSDYISVVHIGGSGAGKFGFWTPKKGNMAQS